jgi:hypothetical protein
LGLKAISPWVLTHALLARMKVASTANQVFNQALQALLKSFSELFTSLPPFFKSLSKDLVNPCNSVV